MTARSFKLLSTAIFFLARFLYFDSQLALCQPQIFIQSYRSNLDVSNKIKNNLIDIMYTFNSLTSRGSIQHELNSKSSEKGFDALLSIIEANKISFRKPIYNLELITSEETGGYQIRDVEVTIKPWGTNQESVDHLIFDFDATGKLTDVKYSIWSKYYFYETDPLISIKDKNRIEDFLELYRTAFVNKNITKISLLLSDKIIITVGKVVTLRSSDGKVVEKKIELFNRTKEQYLENLQMVFRRNPIVDPKFHFICVARHKIYPEIYCISFLQRWYSTTYQDIGWIFLVLDCSDKKDPIIYVRYWSPSIDRFQEDFGFKFDFISPGNLEKSLEDYFEHSN